jgi:hypothetical protein
MDNRSRRFVELLSELQGMVGQGDVCGSYSVSPGTEPNVEVTVKVPETGQTLVFRLWRAEIEQWPDLDPETKLPVEGSQGHLKIIGDVASVEQIPPAQGT